MARDRPFARRIKQPFRLKLLLQAHERFVQVALPGPAHALDLNLIIAPWFIKCDGDAKLESFTRPRHKTHRLSPAAEHHGTNRGTVVLDGEIPVPGCRRGEVGYFSAQPDTGE